MCLSALAVLVVTTSITSFDRERRRVSSELGSAARVTADELAEGFTEISSFLGPIASQPAMRRLDASSCTDAFSGLAGFLAQSGHVHLLHANGSQACSVGTTNTELAPVIDDKAKQVLARGQSVPLPPADDPISGRLAQTTLVPVPGDNGEAGILVAVIYVGTYGVEVPSGLPDSAQVLLLDPSRTRVAVASPNAERFVDRRLSGTDLRDLKVGKAATISGLDGGDQLAFAAEVPGSDLTVVVTLPTAVAMSAARKQLWQNLAIGGLAVLVIAALGLSLHGRLARPLRRLTGAIRAAGRGDDGTWAPAEGPAELAEMASAFNEMLGERRNREAELAYRALHDVLTGLPNRAALLTELADVLGTSRTAAVLFLDLDRFKLINDTHGHAVGDALLVALGKRLKNMTRSGCTVARFGGDEFVILSPDTNETEALIVAERLRSALDGCFKVQGHELYVTGSVGVAVGAPGDAPDEVLRNADTAMYRAKEQGRPGYAFFDQEMRARSVWRLDVEQDLHLALERGEFRLMYQPIFEVRTGHVVGAEALIRWEHPVRGMVSPADFIPVAEETGLIVPIGDWVLGEACRQAAAWRAQYGRGVRVAVNLAARQLTQTGLAEQVARHLSAAGALPEDLILEITEHGVLEDFASASAHLEDVRALGVKVSVDDFGTGWSSLTYLQRLPIDELKIDRSFISNLGPEGTAVPIVGSLVGMAHGLGLSVVAEGVETAEQLRMLRQLGCDLAQGFLLARPGPATAMDSIVADPILLS